MSPFFIIFFTVYGAMHFYAFVKARNALAFGLRVALPLGFFMAAMVLTPMIIRLVEKQGLETAARIFSYTGYLWMGFILLFCSAAAAFDLYRLIVYLSSLISRKDLSFLYLSASYSFVLPLIISLAATSYGYFEAKDIRTEKITIATSKLPASVGKITVVQISDLHIGLIIRENRLKAILSEVKKAKPDMLVSTGDLVDGQINKLNGLSDLFREINPQYGKFAVTGNHEFYAGLSQALEFTRNAGFTMLRGEYADGPITVAGLDDPAVKDTGLAGKTSEEELLSGLDNKKFVLLLKHRPLVNKPSVGLFDLQLSGHTHKGQLFPFSLLARFYYPVAAGLAELSGSSHLYVNRGSGTWGPPIRLFSSPEITVIEIVHKKGS